MPRIRFIALPTEVARAYRAGAPDANGQRPERHLSAGSGVPCRHCLGQVANGDPYLILAHRPFPAPQPYAEVGPIFLHGEECPRYPEVAATPPMFLGWERMIVRGYGADDRIRYGTGAVVPTAELAAAAAGILAQEDVAYVHARSASNNCYQCRIERA